MMPRWFLTGLGAALAILGGGCAPLIGADFSDKTLCEADCPTSGVAPAVLASGQDAPSALAVDSAAVYWINGGSSPGEVQRCALGGCDNTPDTLADTQDDPLALAVDPSNVYWLDGTGKVMACGVAGCNDAPVTLASSDNEPTGIAIDEKNVYWTDRAGNVEACAIGGCSAPEVLVDNQQSPGVIATDGENVYFASSDRVLECAVAGCADQPTLLAASPNVSGITVDAANVYWATVSSNGSGSVMKCAIGGCNGHPTTLASGLADPKSVASDGVSIYWIDDANGEREAGDVSKCAVEGGAKPTQIVTNVDFPSALALSQTHVYWATKNDGQILALPK